MPRGRGGRGSGHKGQRRHFTNPDELEAQKEKAEKERIWRAQRGDTVSDEDDDDEEEGSSSSSDEDEEKDGESKVKGVQHLIETSNPNRVVRKAKKVPVLEDVDEKEVPELSRREREELERQKAKAHYMKLHAAGKTDQARQDMARLAIIRKQRDDAARKREDERKAKEAAQNAKTEAVNRALGKKET